MIDESLIKSHFVGRDGFRWWIGQIAPVESQEKQYNKSGWGNRAKVRIMGYHPYNEGELSNEDLPWAQVLLSNTDGSGASNYATSHKLRPGDIVLGFFLDGDNSQIPVITGCFGRTDQVPIKEFSSPFVPFTGYTEKVPNDGSKLKKNEENSQNQKAQEAPLHVPPSAANKVNQISYSSAINDTVYLATNKPGSKVNKIQTELINAIKFVENIKSYPNIAQDWIDEQIDKLCDVVSEKITAITNDIVGGIINDTYEKMVPALKQGSEKLYDTVNSTVFGATQSKSQAHLEAARAQEATIEPVKQLQKFIPCLIANIIKAIGKLIGEMVCSLLKNAANIVKCVIDQFIGGLLNAIIGLITSALSAILGALSILLSFTSFDLIGSLTQSIQGLLGIPFSLNCGEESTEDLVQKWTIGIGPESPSSFDLDDIMGVMNTINSIIANPESTLSELESIIGPLDFLNPNISVPDINGVLGECFGGIPTEVIPAVVDIFGGGGEGASAVPIFGSIITGINGLNTGSIIGMVVTSGGSGYTYPPFIRVNTDRPSFGYGAVGKSIIKDGKVIAIIMDSEGEGYPVGNNPNATITDVIIINPGIGYKPSDIATDNLGNDYNLTIDNGSIVSVTPLITNDIKLDSQRPIIKIKSETGSGAILKPVFGLVEEPEATISNVIIENPGSGYQPTDTVSDNCGNQYELEVIDGRITNVIPINIREICNNFSIIIISNTGSGAVLKPVFKRGLVTKVEQIIDCIT